MKQKINKQKFAMTLVLIICVMTFVAAVMLTNYSRTDLNDFFNDNNFNRTRFGNYSICASTASCFCQVSNTETTKLTPVVSSSADNVCGGGASGLNKIYSNYNYYREDTALKQWDVWTQFDGTFTVVQAGDSDSYNRYAVALYDQLSGQQIELYNKSRYFTDGATIAIPLQKWHVRIVPGSYLAYLYNESGYLNTTANIPNHPINWKNYTVVIQSNSFSRFGSVAASGGITLNIYNYSVYETDLPFAALTDTYNPSVYETTNQIFDMIFLVNSTNFNAIQNPKFIYDGIPYTPDIATLNSTTGHLRKVIDVPSVSTNTPFDFSWNFTLSGPAGSFNTGSAHTQNVNDTLFEECNATNTVSFLNITTYEMGTFAIKNASINLAFQYWLGSGTTYDELIFNDLNANKSKFNFCFKPADETITMDGYINYYWTNPITNETFPNSQYYFNGAALSNISTILNLYMITDNSSELVTFKVIDENFNPIQNAYVIIQAWDMLTDSFYTVAMIKTNVLGEGTTYIKRYTQWYQYQVIYNNHIYLTTDPLIETQLTRQLQITLAKADVYDEFNNIEYTFTYNNNTGVFSFDWADTTGKVATACLKVQALGNTTTLSNDCSSTTSGTLTYTLTQNGTFVGSAIFIDNQSIYKTVKTIVVTRGTPERFTIIGSSGLIPAFILIGTLGTIGIAFGSIPLALMLTCVGIVVAFVLGAAKFNPMVIYSLIAIAVVIAVLSRRRFG